MADVAYRELSQSESLFKTLIWDPLVQSGQLALLTSVPILNAPVISTIIKTLIKFFSDQLFDTFKLLVDVSAIKMVNAEHQKAYESASLKLKVIAVEKGIDSDAFIQARNDATLALANFVRFGAVK